MHIIWARGFTFVGRNVAEMFSLRHEQKQTM